MYSLFREHFQQEFHPPSGAANRPEPPESVWLLPVPLTKENEHAAKFIATPKPYLSC